MKKTLTRLPAISCPHCDAKSIVRTSEDVADMVREIRLECTNADCGHSFLCQLSVIRTIRPSRTPREGVDLPFANPNLVGPDSKPANDDEPRHGNDNHDDGDGVAALMTT